MQDPFILEQYSDISYLLIHNKHNTTFGDFLFKERTKKNKHAK